MNQQPEVQPNATNPELFSITPEQLLVRAEAIKKDWGIHLNGVTQASCSPRAVRWRALQARRVSAR